LKQILSESRVPGVATIAGSPHLARLGYTAFYFVALKPWDERETRTHAGARRQLNGRLATQSGCVRICVHAAAIRGSATPAVFVLVQDRAEVVEFSTRSPNVHRGCPEAAEWPSRDNFFRVDPQCTRTSIATSP